MTTFYGHQFDPRVKRLLVYCSSEHPLQFDMPHDHVRKNTPATQVPLLRHGPGTE